MYIDTSHITRGGKTDTRHLLRESYRANGKVLHRTLANVSHCSAAEIEAMRLALRHKDNLEHLGTIPDAITLKQGVSFGAVWTVYHIARRVGIEKALGPTREGKLALWQVVARVLDQGSRLRPCVWPCPMPPVMSSASMPLMRMRCTRTSIGWLEPKPR